MPSATAPEPRLAELIPLPELADRVGRGRVTLWRWSVSGRRRPDGSRVRLRAVRVGDRLLSCVRWFKEFKAELRVPA
jgi:hypothetical protein